MTLNRRMEFIDTIEIKNFKSIRHQKIEGCKRVNIFIGYPNVGKSNILEALSLFSIEEQNLNFSSFVRIESLTTLFFNGEIGKQAEVRINDKHRFVARFKGNSIEFKQQFEREGTSFEKEDTGQIFLDDSSDVSVKKHFYFGGEKEIKIFDYKRNSIGKENDLPTIRKYDFLKRISYSIKDYFELSYPYGENLFSIISTNSALRKEIEELFVPYKLEMLYDTREQKFTILKRTSGGIFSIPYELVADTLQRLIFFKTSISSNKQTILLFEEPEAHMFPPYISKFTSDVMYDENNNQFFIATHSPFVINDFMENLKKDDYSIYTVGYDNETGETLIRRMADDELHEIYQYGVDLFLNLENYLPHAQQQ
ncbi:MAG: AAA family ATPase [Ferruginibacter sp.]